MSDINRFRITEKSFGETKKFLAGELSKSYAPKYAVAFETDLTVEAGKVLYKGLPLIPVEKRDQYFRDAVYTKGSTVPLNRDQGWVAINKLAKGLPRRAWATFILKQASLRQTDPAPDEDKKSGRPAKDLGDFETDLMEVMPGQLRKVSPELAKIKHSFIVTTVHNVSSYTKLHWIKTKTPGVATPKIIEAIEEICKKINIPVRGTTVRSDAGHEIDTGRLKARGITHIVQKIATAVEARNGVARRTLFKILKAKRGGFASSLQQTEDILNNMASFVHKGKTPTEVLLQSANESIDQYNTKRQRGSNNARPALKVGDFVRRTLRNKKDTMYKSNQGSWDNKKYEILGVTKKQPHRYRLEITEKIKNKVVTHKKWFTRDKIQLLSKHDDSKSAELLNNRLQSGSTKAARKPPKPRKAPSPPPPRRRSGRAAARRGIEKRRATDRLMKSIV